MASSLLTGVSGLLANQRFLEVIGNNIANANTNAFKSQRVVFSDLLYETIRPATSGSGDDTGGVNPRQVGNGVAMAQTDRRFTQGSIENTGEQFDLALNGGGFFVVSDGVDDFYTRAGAFNLDAENKLTTSEGLRVQRFGTVGEAEGFQQDGDGSINIPLGQAIAGIQTTEISLLGNLDSSSPYDQAEVATSSTPFMASGVPATGTTLLNDLASNTVDYVIGDHITLSGQNADGTQISTAPIPVDGTTTMQDLINSINATVTGFSASLTGGNIVLTADNAGAGSFDLVIRDDSSNIAGRTSFSDHLFQVTTEGQDMVPFPINIVVYDSRGDGHELMLNFERQSDDVWQLNATMDPQDGTVVDGLIDNISFNDRGELIATGDTLLELNIVGISQPMQINVDFNQGAADSLTHYQADSTIEKTQDGAAPGILTVAEIGMDGLITGRATNGVTVELAQLAIASFENPRGLAGIGGSLFRASLNSGLGDIGVAMSGDRGGIQSGSLESSNVDMAFEFTRLIVAQRGFAANARTITISDEVLEELTNMIR